MAPTNPVVFLDPTMTTLIIGPEKRKYIIHKELLRAKLGYFKTAYTMETAEASSNVFEMHDIPDRAIRSLIAWLYTGKVFLDPGNTDALDEDSKHSEDSEDKSTSGDAYEEWEEESLMEDVDQQDEGEPTGEQEDKEADREDDGDGHWEGDGEVDYEYDSGSDPDDSGSDHDDSGSETEDFEDDETNGGGDASPSAPEAFEDQEARLVKATFPDSEPSELDAYQIGVLIQVHSSDLAISDPTFVPKWKLVLEQMRDGVQIAGDKSFNLDVYDGLVDLYIVGHRFLCRDLCGQVVTLLETEQRAQSEMLHGQALPSFQTVSKAFESLPAQSCLRLWLLHIFAKHWRPSGDSADQVAARDLLPKDFLLALALTAAERIHFTAGAEDVPSWQSLWIDYDYEPGEIDPVWQNRGR
ncbi:hypothetical protein PRZ48_011363 [Zasmidium cellare]|uniref:BTB domain-containing protein n=1 Tax=Zasmidium cellare TaxID=395010 RepID=A0ABR0E679_ZASCE|nr:hypothetical protein PRZ48_011363 [Zasmidium cellare]